MKKLLMMFLPITMLFLLLAPTARAQAAERITSFSADITINRDNMATIRETISYDFGSNQKRGIFRLIPIETRAGDSGQFYYYDFELRSVTQDGQPAETLVDRQGSYQSIRIGNPDRTLTGRHTYQITYSISPIVEQTPDGSLLNWNITGNNWEVPILSASAEVRFDQDIEVQEMACYTGPAGTQGRDCNLTEADGKLSVTAGNINPGEGLTVLANLGDTSFSQFLTPEDPPPVDLRPGIAILLGGIGLAGGIGLRLLFWRRERRQQKHQTIVTQYEAPAGLTPGEIGLLYDKQSDMKEITATLIDLAVRGYLKIEQTAPKSLFKKAEYQFHLLKAYDDVAEHEKELLDLFFDNNSKSSVYLHDISQSKAARAVVKVRSILDKSLDQKGYLASSLKISEAFATKKRWFIPAAVVLGVWGLTYTLMLIGERQNVVPALVTTLIGGVMLLIGWLIAQHTSMTELGIKGWAEIEGFKRYMTVVEKDRLAFHDAPEKNPQRFNQVLPYAVALGVEKQWAKQFEGMDITSETNWYSSAHGFNAALLASTLSSDFSPAIASSLSPPTQSSGGGVSGGFSGGGGGGGGGGSW